MTDIEKLNRKENPFSHISMYVNTLRPMEVNNEALAGTFSVNYSSSQFFSNLTRVNQCQKSLLVFDLAPLLFPVH